MDFKKLVPVSIIVAILVIGGIVVLNKPENPGKEGSPLASLSSQEVGQKTLKYINETFLKPGMVASLVNIEEESGLYKMKFEVENEEVSVYVSQDGLLLFPQSIDLNPVPPREIPKTEVPDIELFVMSFCPFGNQAEEIMFPVWQLLGDKAHIELRYIFYSNYGSGYPDYCLDEDEKYCSMHGISELNQGLRELCVYKHQEDKFWDFVMEINKECTYQDVEEKWEGVALGLEIDASKIKDCQMNEGLVLAQKEVEISSREYDIQDPSAYGGQEKMSVGGSPTLVINGMIYEGPRTPEGYKQGICNAFINPPDECSQVLGDVDANSGEGSCQ